MISGLATAPVRDASLNDRLCAALEQHFDPVWGSAFWLRRATDLGIDPRREIRTVADLPLLDDLAPADLLSERWVDFAPRRLHDQLHRLIVVQTGGATGPGAWTAYTRDDFEAAFVRPFLEAADFVGFPRRRTWLYAGPSGPHVIGLAARRLAEEMGGQALFIDFDPRWVRKLEAGSFAQRRYLTHVVDQCLPILREQGVDVLFTTPPVAVAISEALTDSERERIAGVHYGGMPLTREALRLLQQERFPNAIHLSGYGNTLFGCMLELRTEANRELDYFAHGDRLHVDLVDRGDADGAQRVRLSRFDEAHLLLNMVERDVAGPAAAPSGAPGGFAPAGVRNPHTPRTPSAPAAGLY